jgi:ABC-type glycerol-3-phosphate transport system substrate-binding protein
VLATLGLAAGSAPLLGCGRSALQREVADPADLSNVRQQVAVWGPTGTTDLGRQAQVDRWNGQHATLTATYTPAPFTSAQGIEGLQKLFATVAAGDPPDAAWIDRFQLSNLAVRKTLGPLDDRIKRDKYSLRRHFPPLLEEVTGIDGKTFGLPSSTDNRALWWNKRGLRDAGLDTEKGPRTWDELRLFAARATRSAADGGIDQLGWNYRAPGFGILYLWSWLAGAEFLSKDGRTAHYDHPGVLDALSFLLAGADAQGGPQKVDAYLGTAGQAGDPFVTERVLMQLAQPTGAVARQRPEMEFGWAPVPVRKPGDKIQTFAGGFAWAVPTGTKNPDVSWALLTDLMSDESLGVWASTQAAAVRGSGGVYQPGFTTVEAVDRSLRRAYATTLPLIDAAWDFTIDLMQYARVRPVSPAAAEAWDALSDTWNSVLGRKQTPAAACAAMNARVQKALDEAYGSAQK